MLLDYDVNLDYIVI